MTEPTASSTCTSRNDKDNNDEYYLPNNSYHHHVVIVGGGLAGLLAARHLLRTTTTTSPSPTVRVTLVEAQDRLGGRVRAHDTFVPGYPLDVGAEFIHCVDTILTETIFEYQLTTLSSGSSTTSTSTCCSTKSNDYYEEWEAYFVTAHADGGPDESPTRDGKYGMYYVDGQLLMYNDASLQPLSAALQDMMEHEGSLSSSSLSSSLSSSSVALPKEIDPSRSIADALESYQLSPSLVRLAVAGYGNTAGCTDMNALSWRILAQFEHYWDKHESDGDYRLPARVGMTSLVRALHKDLQQYATDNRLEIRLGWPVSTIEHDCTDQQQQQEEKQNMVLVHGVHEQNRHSIPAHAVICTVPPPLLPQVLPNLLTAQQRHVLQYIGLETVAKVMLKFDHRPWPEHLQSVVCADGGPLPEIWFRNNLIVPSCKDNDGDTINNDNSNDKTTYHVMVGYLASGLADEFLSRINMQAQANETTAEIEATDLCLAQLSNILRLSQVELRDMHVDTLVHAWNAESEPFTPGGYMYPKTGLDSLQPLAEPCKGGRVVLAGEATNAGAACCTMQAAMESGVRAAKQVLDILKMESSQ